jgi:tripartite-type tricarboxylate transporter receptor subunit TctC
MKRVVVAALATAGILLSNAASADSNFPNRPIRMIIPSTPGGGGDVFGRLIAEGMKQFLGQPIIIENNPAGGGTVATLRVSQSAPDGYTIGLGLTSTLTIAPAVFEKLPYDPVKDFTMIARAASGSLLLIAVKEFPASDVRGLIAEAKKDKNGFMYGTWGTGTMAHLCGAAVSQKSGVPMTNVPYKGSNDVATALLTGDVKVGWVDMATGMTAVNTGKIKPIGLCGARTPLFPELATLKQSGLDLEPWGGFFLIGPAGMPEDVVQKLGEATRKTLEIPEVARTIRERGQVPDFMPGPEHAKSNAREIEEWKQIAKSAGVKLD